MIIGFIIITKQIIQKLFLSPTILSLVTISWTAKLYHSLDPLPTESHIYFEIYLQTFDNKGSAFACLTAHKV